MVAGGWVGVREDPGYATIGGGPAMPTCIPNGVWPTMITPFTDTNTVDYAALGELIEWYIEKQVDGLFAVCQSSEMFYLSLEERVDIAKHVVKQAARRVPVIASAHISDHMPDQIEEMKAISDTGIDAMVLVTNRLAGAEESEDAWKRNAEILFQAVPDTLFGFYECPYPYKRLLSPELLAWCASTERVLFLKDTSCNIAEMRAKVEAVQGTDLKIFNANAATLLETLKLGVSGYSGVMANFHPELYVWLTRQWSKEPKRAQELQDFLGVASLIERQLYPVNAKYYLQLEGLEITLSSRVKDAAQFTLAERLEVRELRGITERCRQGYTMDSIY